MTSTFLCVGAFLDFASGTIRRAPDLVRRLRGEWLYRLALEPRRLSGRYLVGGPVFMADVLRQWLAGALRAGKSRRADDDRSGWTAGRPKRER